MLVIAGTGHRPQKLGGFSPLVTERLTDLAVAALKLYKPDRVISGGALGWDTAVALASLKLNIPLVLAVPFKGQESRWSDSQKQTYYDIGERASRVVVVSEGFYQPYKMQVRNCWMVDNSNMMLALWDGSRGGTGNCVRYANEKKVSIKNLWNNWIKYKNF